jgi:hypothetical protein
MIGRKRTMLPKYDVASLAIEKRQIMVVDTMLRFHLSDTIEGKVIYLSCASTYTNAAQAVWAVKGESGRNTEVCMFTVVNDSPFYRQSIDYCTTIGKDVVSTLKAGKIEYEVLV